MKADHILKTDPGVFQLSLDGKKDYEIRYDDRGFAIGDTVTLVETVYTGKEMSDDKKPLVYTGRAIRSCIASKLSGCYGIDDGWCILGLKHKDFVNDWTADK